MVTAEQESFVYSLVALGIPVVYNLLETPDSYFTVGLLFVLAIITVALMSVVVEVAKLRRTVTGGEGV